MCARLEERFSELPEPVRRTRTLDQGHRDVGHQHFTVATDMPAYFCSPLSPWQRPTNENTYGLLRQFFEKGNDLAGITAADCDGSSTPSITDPDVR